MPELCHPDGGGILGHELRAGGKPLVTSRDENGFIVDVLAPGPEGAGRCECGETTRWWRTDAERKAAHARHLQAVRHRQDRQARKRLSGRSGVVEVARRRQERHEGRGHGGRGVKGGSQGLAHGSSRCRKRVRECVPHSPLCAAERRLHPLLTC